MDNLIVKLYQSPQTILTNTDIAMIWQETDPIHLKSKIAYYVKRGALIHLTRGIFAKNKTYSSRELATNIYTPSYISFETILRDAGMIFQHYDTIFLAGPWSKTIRLDHHTFTFRKLKNALLYNPTGTTITDHYTTANPERAFLDMIYLFRNYSFDNLRALDWEKCSEYVLIYANKQMMKRFYRYKKQYAP
ncbi:MAG: hypothetical protein AAB557_05140 [Patescibacteria group bacterium]